MPPTPQPGDLTPQGISTIQGIIMAWLYTTVSQLDYIQTTTDTKAVIVGKLYADLSPHAPISMTDLGNYVDAIQNDANNSFTSVGNVLLTSVAVKSITTFSAPTAGVSALVAQPMGAWTGGGHPQIGELTAALA